MTMKEAMRDIMMTAWTIRRKYKVNMSVALKAAWAAIKVYDTCKSNGTPYSKGVEMSKGVMESTIATCKAMAAEAAKKAATNKAFQSGIFTSTEKVTIENECFLPKSRSGYGRYVYKHTVLEALAVVDEDGKPVDGCIELAYPQSKTFDKSSAKARVTYEISAGYDGKFFGIDFDKVSKIKGNTYDIKETIKDLGYHWDKAERCWVR